MTAQQFISSANKKVFNVSTRMAEPILTALDIYCTEQGITKASFTADAILEKLGGPTKVYELVNNVEECGG